MDKSPDARLMTGQREQSIMGRLPLLPSMRVYHTWFSWIAGAFAYGAATWVLLTGGYLGSFMSPPIALASFALGQAIALVFCVAYAGLVSTKYGIDTTDAAKPAFGLRGSQLITALIVVIMVGWILVLVAFTGSAMTTFASQTLNYEPSRMGLGVFTLVIVSICGLVAMTGPRVFARLYNFISPLMLCLVFVLLGVLVRDYGFGGLFALRPPAENELPTRDGFALGTELGMSWGFAYWISIGAMFRLVKSQRLAIHGSLIGWGILTLPVAAVGIFSSLAVGTEDPTVWMYELAGSWGGAVGLLFIIIANISSTVLMIYIALIALQQSKPLARVPSRTLVIGMLLPTIWVAFWPALLFEWYATFLYYNAVLIAPIAAILTVDYFILRRQHIDIRHVFTWKHGSKYWYWHGVNWVSMVVVVFGFIVYNLLYNPVSGEYTQLFTYITATVPTVVSCGVLYWVLMRTIVLPRGLGGFDRGLAEQPRGNFTEVDDVDLTL